MGGRLPLLSWATGKGGAAVCGAAFWRCISGAGVGEVSVPPHGIPPALRACLAISTEKVSGMRYFCKHCQSEVKISIMRQGKEGIRCPNCKSILLPLGHPFLILVRAFGSGIVIFSYLTLVFHNQSLGVLTKIFFFVIALILIGALSLLFDRIMTVIILKHSK